MYFYLAFVRNVEYVHKLRLFLELTELNYLQNVHADENVVLILVAQVRGNCKEA